MRLAATLLFALLILATSPVTAHAAGTHLALTNVRAVRISTTSITLSFSTDEQSIGRIEYMALDGSDITLSDSAAQTDHLFTLDELDPSRGYTFTLSASGTKADSYRHVILLAPQSIGDTGQSIIPPMDIIDDDGTKISSVRAASTTPYAAPRQSVWPIIVSALVAGGLLAGRRLLPTLPL